MSEQEPPRPGPEAPKTPPLGVARPATSPGGRRTAQRPAAGGGRPGAPAAPPPPSPYPGRTPRAGGTATPARTVQGAVQTVPKGQYAPMRPPYQAVPLPPMFSTWWPAPAAPAAGVVGTAIGLGLVGALLFGDTPRVGVNVPVVAVLIAAWVGLLARRRGEEAGRRYPIGRVRAALGLVAVGLTFVAALRDSPWLVTGCILAAITLAAAAALDLRRWVSLLATLPLFGTAAARGIAWAGSAPRPEPVRRSALPWLTGLGIGAVCVAVVGTLLASADAAFADLVDGLVPSVDLSSLPGRLFAFALVGAVALGLAFAVSARVSYPREGPVRAGRRWHPAEWFLPLVLVALTILLFLTVEATTLFGDADVVRRTAETHAGRAREGFGQLLAVTLLVLGLLAWASSVAARGGEAHRRLMGGAGGALLLLTLALAGSALRRLWLYQDAYGWTVTRVNAGAFELWVVAVLLGTGLAWLLRRTDLVPRLVAGSAGLGLLAVALLGPDALAASANVDRFERTGKIDLLYLSTLSDDAVPALSRLPGTQAACTLAGREAADDPWTAWNLSRARARPVLDDLGPASPLSYEERSTLCTG